MKKTKKIIKILFINCLSLFFLNSCTTKSDLSNIREVKYSADISNIIASKCGSSECHGKDAMNSSLIGYEELLDNGEVKEGNARGSKLYKMITGRGFIGTVNRMPPKGNTDITDREISLIYVWIEQGAKNN